MAITLGTEVALSIYMDSALTYGDIETALVDAGFVSYTIMRNVNFDNTCDAQLFVRNEMDGEGAMEPLSGAETLTMLSTAVAAMVDAQSA